MDQYGYRQTDWTAGIIVVNGTVILWHSIGDLMDRQFEPELYDAVRKVAEQVPQVQAVEKLGLRRAGLNVFVDTTFKPTQECHFRPHMPWEDKSRRYFDPLILKS